MPSFREHIQNLTQQNYARKMADAELQKSQQFVDHNYELVRAEKFWQIAIGLGHLAVLLSSSSPNYSGLLKKSENPPPYYQTEDADGYFKELPESKFFKGKHEGYWLFGENTMHRSG